MNSNYLYLTHKSFPPLHLDFSPSFLHPRNKKFSLSSFEKTSQRMFGQQENENVREGKTEQGSVYSIYLYILHLHPSLYILQWMHGNIYREVFPTFLAKKSYDWWITKRRMEIYTKISKRKDLKWSWRKQRKICTTHGLCEF